jgi:hypothetical protein
LLHEKCFKNCFDKTITLENGNRFQYSITQAELQNVLGATAAVVDEYTINGEGDKVYNLYKTKEGNWHNIAEQSKGTNTSILQQLKRELDARIADVANR